MKKIFVVLLAFAALGFCGRFAFCAQEELTKEKIISIAIEQLKGKGVTLDGVNIIYDEGGKLWSQKSGITTVENQSPNHGLLVKGFLKNYRVVYFDFNEPLPDMWVFIDKDTGEVLDVIK